jgi:multisubunit Na+/H+ antiporter MnhB subunit
MDRLTNSRQLIGGALVAAALLILLIGYANIRNETEVALQMPYILTAGVGALVLTALGVVVLRSRDDQAILESQAETESAVRDLTQRVAFMTQLLEAALLPDHTINVTNSSQAPAKVR